MDQSAATWVPSLQHAAKSDVGLRRANNQDAMVVVLAGSQQTFQQRGHLLMVADGMGAHAAGELASKIATDVVPLAYHKLLDRSPPEAILAAVTDANNQIHSRGQASPEFKGMGTTSTVLVLLPQGALLAHVGDSRAYRLRGHRLDQLTFDHSLVWELRQSGQMSEEAMPPYITKNIITRSLGPNPEVRVDLEGPFPIEAGDTFLLCSDGLSGQLSDEEIGTVLGCLPPDEAVQSLVDLANLRGGPDNITVIVARVTGPQVGEGNSPPPKAATAARSSRHASVWLWPLGVVFLLAALGLFALGHILAALASLAVAVVAVIVALTQQHGKTGRESSFGADPLGRGPYTTCDCTPNGAIVDRLADVLDQLRSAATKEQWTVDWNHFNVVFDQAAAARKAADFAQAARAYLHAMSFLLAQLKHQHRAADDASADVL